MLGVFELIHIIGLIGDQALNLPSRSLMDIQRSPEIKVYAAKMKQEGPIWINHCTYEGVFVEYTRTGEEERNGTVWPAEPDTPAGFALILTKANCPDKGAEEAIFAVGEQVFHPKRVIRETQRISSLVLNADNQEKHSPAWLSQVMETIEKEAPSNPTAQAFLSEMAMRKGSAVEVGEPQVINADEDAPKAVEIIPNTSSSESNASVPVQPQ